jgi:glycosyltransferase involved in cell wall biosynthesis
VKKVSVLIPCYNAQEFIVEAITSAINQEYEPKEVIVIDDGSTDNSLELLKTFGSAIQLVARENRGGNFTRNELLQMAKGEWIQYLDADDYLSPGKLAEQINWIDKNPGFDVVYGAVMVVYDDGKERKFDKQDVIYPDDPWAALVSWELPQTSSPLFRKEALIHVGGWNNEQRVCQEHELYLRLLQANKSFIGVKDFEHLAHYRQWSDNTVSRKNVLGTYHARIKIMQEAYQFMFERELLTEQHRMVFMEWCLLVSRGCWSVDRKLSLNFFDRNRDVYPLLKIRSKFLKMNYLRVVKWIGLNNAERLAKWIRKFLAIAKNAP